MIHNVCRLCLGTQDLMWIFNAKMADNMPEIIQVTSGVEITKNDAITQMVCSTCCQITIKMFKFRTTSIKNDKDLKAKCIGLNINPVLNSPAVKKESPISVAPVTSPSNKTKVTPTKSSLATIRIVTATAGTPSAENKPITSGSNSTSRASTPAIPHSVKIPINQKHKFVHPSIRKLVETYPDIKLPDIPLNSHVEAYITLQTDEVDEWYKEKNYSENDIEKMKKAGADYARRYEKNSTKKKGRKRKLSIESTSSTASKRSTNSDKSVSPQSSIKGVRPNSELNIKTVISPASKPSSSVEPKINFSKSETRLHVNNNSAPIKSKADTTVKSTEIAKANTNIESQEKRRLTKQFDTRLGHRRIIKPISDSESDITDATDTSEFNVKSNVTLTMDSNGFISSIKARSDHNADKTYDGSARTRRNSTTNGKNIVQPNVSSTTKPSESVASESSSNITMSPTLHSLLAEQNTSKTDATEINLRSLLSSTKTRTTNKRKTTERNYSELGSDSDADDPSYDPGYDPGDDDYHCDSDGEKEAEEPISSTNEKSSNKSRQNSPDGSQQKCSDALPQKCSDALQQRSSDGQQQRSSDGQQQSSSDGQQQSSSDVLQQQPSDGQQQSSPDALKQKSSEEAPQLNSSEAPQLNSSDPPQQIRSDLSQQNPSKEPQEEKKEEYSLFTTRPFVKNAEERRKRQLKYKQRLKEGDNDCELLVLTDTDSEDDLMIVPVTENDDATDKSAFVNSLELTPKDSSNEPDLSLVSVTSRTWTLHICNICDSHHGSQKELKIHQRKTHTKCPICNKRFRSLASRDEHKYMCIANNSPYELKTVVLELKRVNEIEEIRNRFPKAFETSNEHDYCINKDKAPSTQLESAEVQFEIGAVGSVPPQLELDTAGSSVNLEEANINDTPIDTAVKELEKFLQNTQSSSLTKEDVKDANSRKSTDEAESIRENVPGGDDIICISDDEADKAGAKNTGKNEKPKLGVVNHDILKGINTQDTDMNILRKIIIEAKARKVSKNYNLMKVNENIIDGSSPKVKIFKKLRKHLQSYTIPIEISYSPTLSVDYKYRESPPIRKVTDLWYTMPCQDFKYSSQKQSLHVPPSSKQTINPPPLHLPKQPLQNSSKPNTSRESLSSSSKQPVNILPSYTLAAQQLRVSAPNSIKPNGLLLTALTNNTSQSVIRQPNIFQTNGKDVQGQMVQISAAQDTSVGATRTMNYTSSPIINTCNIPTHTGPQVFIGSSQNLSTSTNSYIIVAPMKTSNDNMNIPNLAPLPVIQSVASAQERVGTVSTTDPYRPHSNETTVQQPSIRVKNLSELS